MKGIDNVYWYEFKHRGLSPGCQPRGFVEHKEELGRFGHISYGRQLTDKEITDYELKEVKS